MIKACESTTHDEQHIGGVDLDELLVWMLTPTLRRNRGCGSFKDLQECLLHSLTGNIAGDRWVLALARNLVDFVDVDDAGFGLLHVVVRSLDQLQQDVFDVFADVSSLGQRRRVRDRNRDIDHPRQSLGEQRLAGTGWPQQQNV